MHTLFSYHSHGQLLSPFLLLDRAGLINFPPAEKPRGIGSHPHRGFETFTIVYEGEVSHRDSTGEGGLIQAGVVQWMTAGSGILHEEFHSQQFTKVGGKLDMVQLWVNLPAKDKIHSPRYQAIRRNTITEVRLTDDAGLIRVIAGNYDIYQGPTYTFFPIQLLDIRLPPRKRILLSASYGWNSTIIVTPELMVGSVHNKISEQGTLLDEATRSFITKHLHTFELFLSGILSAKEKIVGNSEL